MTKVGPVKLAYDVYEPSSGADSSLTPVIYMHGVSGSKENFRNIAQIIADKTKRKGYAYDARNHGDSEQTDDYSFEMNSSDLFDFMDTIKTPKAILIGSSMGGMTAIKAALKKPERIEMIFVEDMFVKKCPKEMLEMVIGFINLWLACVATIPKELNEKEAVKHCVDILYSKLPADQQLIGDKEKMYNAGFVFKRGADGAFDVKFNKKAILNALKNAEETMSEATGQYDGPAYFIYGSISPFCVGKEEEHIKKHFPNAELIPVEGAAHDVHLAFAEKFLELVIQRLKR
ncbi:sn-1-specific diacylglycerol lipase ABHD11 [Parasteatoda tepidariorum]|uniref:sn-1-specific diacylglycerol lipase ABHD11 n=1 Tax=Parasteatoda tepidariorum TaxID=114398 RepID=UPI00077FC682|nr:protein ABHD11 [Parasteatoda tepidariorum]